MGCALHVIRFFFIETTFEKRPVNSTGAEVRSPNAFGFASPSNLYLFSVQLEASIVDWLKNHKVSDINIRKDFKYI